MPLGMRLNPLAGQPLGFGYLFASHPHIRTGLVSGGHATSTMPISSYSLFGTAELKTSILQSLALAGYAPLVGTNVALRHPPVTTIVARQDTNLRKLGGFFIGQSSNLSSRHSGKIWVFISIALFVSLNHLSPQVELPGLADPDSEFAHAPH